MNNIKLVQRVALELQQHLLDSTVRLPTPIEIDIELKIVEVVSSVTGPGSDHFQAVQLSILFPGGKTNIFLEINGQIWGEDALFGALFSAVNVFNADLEILATQIAFTLSRTHTRLQAEAAEKSRLLAKLGLPKNTVWK